MRARAELMAIEFLGVGLAVFKQIYDIPVQHLVIAITEKEGPVNVLRLVTKDILDIAHRIRGVDEIRCRIGEIEHVLVVQSLTEAILISL